MTFITIVPSAAELLHCTLDSFDLIHLSTRSSLARSLPSRYKHGDIRSYTGQHNNAHARTSRGPASIALGYDRSHTPYFASDSLERRITLAVANPPALPTRRPRPQHCVECVLRQVVATNLRCSCFVTRCTMCPQRRDHEEKRKPFDNCHPMVISSRKRRKTLFAVVSR